MNAIDVIETAVCLLGIKPVTESALLITARVQSAAKARRKEPESLVPLRALLAEPPPIPAGGAADTAPVPPAVPAPAVAAARALDTLGTACPVVWRQVAEARIADPGGSWSELATRLGITADQARGRFRRMIIAGGAA